MLFSIIPLLFNQSSVSILHTIYEASFVYVILGLIDSFFVIIDSFLKFPNITDLCLLEVDLPVTVGDIVLYFPLVAKLSRFNDSFNHLTLFPVSFIERIFRMIFKGSFPTCFSTLERPFVSSSFIEQNTVRFRIYLIIFFKLTLEVYIIRDDSC